MTIVSTSLQERTIRAFGRQWTAFPENRGYYASVSLLEDICAPLLDVRELTDKRVCEIGSGSGRIVEMLLTAGAANVLAIEPSEAFAVLQENIRHHGSRVQLLRATGEHIPCGANFDFVFSIGVLHHIPEPEPVVQAAFRSLRPGGKLLIWLYGKEGNSLYLSVVRPLRVLTSRLPHRLLWLLACLFDLPLRAYLRLCRVLPLPMHQYLIQVIGRFEPAERRLVIFDQLNPAYARYYSKSEAYQLLEQAGFQDIRLHHRHGYSWTMVGTKP
jgi:SAM-dependent methyltransferase